MKWLVLVAAVVVGFADLASAAGFDWNSEDGLRAKLCAVGRAASEHREVTRRDLSDCLDALLRADIKRKEQEARDGAACAGIPESERVTKDGYAAC